MLLEKEKISIKRTFCLMLLLSLGLIIFGENAYSQTPPPPPQPPPSPVEVFNKINPFKKNKKNKDTIKTKDTGKVSPAAPAGPPPPPNPFYLFRKKNIDTTKAAAHKSK